MCLTSILHRMSQTNKLVFTALKIVSWIIFVGLCIEAGALVVNVIFSIYRPELVHNLYQQLDLSDVYARSRWTYFSMISFILAIALLKAVMFYHVINLVTKFDLKRPFNEFASKQILLIGYDALAIGLFSYVGRQAARYLQHHGYATDSMNPFWEDSQAFILMAAVIYVIGAIFKRGIELQMENDLTV